MQKTKYRQAAIAYLIYGLLYMGGALYAAVAGVSERTLSAGNALGWFVLGGLIVVVFPLFIWRQFKWFTRILAILLVVRMAGLVYTMVGDSGSIIAMPGGAGIPLAYGTLIFLIVTAITCAMLIRAGWDVDMSRTRTVDRA